MKATAEVEDVFEALGISKETIREHYRSLRSLSSSSSSSSTATSASSPALTTVEDDQEEIQGDEYTTIGGLLCSIAGKIPAEGDEIPFAGYVFRIAVVSVCIVLYCIVLFGLMYWYGVDVVWIGGESSSDCGHFGDSHANVDVNDWPWRDDDHQ